MSTVWATNKKISICLRFIFLFCVLCCAFFLVFILFLLCLCWRGCSIVCDFRWWFMLTLFTAILFYAKMSSFCYRSKCTNNLNGRRFFYLFSETKKVDRLNKTKSVLHNISGDWQKIYGILKCADNFNRHSFCVWFLNIWCCSCIWYGFDVGNGLLFFRFWVSLFVERNC